MVLFSRNSVAGFLLLVLFFISLGQPASADKKGENLSMLPEYISSSDALVRINETPELGFDAFHVQGLAATEKYFYLTSVDKPGFAAWVFKIDRETMELVDRKNLAKLMDFHPGGMDFDGKYLWIPVAVYSPKSHTNIMVVDPETLKFKKAFEVEDHIGAVARLGDVVIGANWNAEDFYFFSLKGKELDKKASPTGVGYQDCKGVSGMLMCNGGGYVDWIDFDEWKLVKRFYVGQSMAGSPLSREGAAFFDGRVFFLPDDGAEGRIYEYAFSGPENEERLTEE